MNLPIVVCPSFLEFFLKTNNLEDIWADINSEFKRRKFIVSEEILAYYEEYFSKNVLLKNVFDNFLNHMSTSKNGFNLIVASENESVKNAQITENIKALLHACCSVDPHIILSEKLEDVSELLTSLNILKLNHSKLFDSNEKHILNEYRLPIIRKRVDHGQNSSEISKFLEPFFKNQNNITIIDSHIFSNPDNTYNFFEYILPLIGLTASIQIITLYEPKLENILKKICKNQSFMVRNVSFMAYRDKKKQHDREIFTDEYHIALGHGIGTFGKSGITDQSDISIARITNLCDKNPPNWDIIL